MNVRCPSCETVYRVDPAKVPETGIKARCAVCSSLIAVHRSMDGAATTAPASAPPTPAPVATTAPAPAPAPPRPVLRPAGPAPVPRPQPAPAAAPVKPPAAAPPRPSAPVFRPTPGAPVQAPAAAAPAWAPAPAAPATASATGKHVNPFLAQDPRQKARRLARALISDMIVYQPDKRQQALKEGTLKTAFDEEIKKSWEEYVQQVGHEVANSTSFFTDALNEILAGGQKVF